MNILIWNELSNSLKQEITEYYNSISKQIRKLKCTKVSREKFQPYTEEQLIQYNQQINELQNYITQIEVYYKCNYCNKIFRLPLDKLKKLFKGETKPLFCDKKCSGVYYANKSHDKTKEEQEEVNKKISNTLLKYNSQLSEQERKDKYGKGANNDIFWKNKTLEERSKILKSRVPKSKQTKLEKYGNENYNNSEQTKITNLEKYGVDNQFKLKENQDKAEQVMLEKYGVPKFFQERNLFKNISLERYGVTHPMQNKQVESKLRNTKLIKYGDSNYNNQAKFEQTMLEKYGVTRPFYVEKFKQKAFKTKLEKYNNKNYNNRPKALKTLYKKYGKDFYKHLTLKTVGNRISKINLKFAKFINCDNFEFPLESYSYDLKYGNTLIEIDPSFTHNSLPNKIYGKFGGIDKNYHSDKTSLARQNGYKCIHIFDWDDWNKIKYLLQDKKTLYARKLQVKEVDKKECNEFLNNYHLQNSCNGQEVRLGLYKDNELIEIMTFGKPRYNKNYQWELLRLCTKPEYKVVGGSEKLFKHFIQLVNPKSIISYCDNSKFSGEVYSKLGFIQKGKPHPSLHWSKDDEHITDNLLRQRGFDQLFNTNYGKGTSNEELMIEHGWLPIYDCGQMTFIWHK